MMKKSYRVIREPKGVDFVAVATPWTEQEKAEFSRIIANSKRDPKKTARAFEIIKRSDKVKARL
jgi:hypothetical protein